MTSQSISVGAQREPAQTDLKEYVRILRARKWDIVVVTLVVVATTMFFTYRQTPIYEGSAQVLVDAIQNPLNPYTVPAPPSMPTERQVAQSQTVAQEVERPAGMSTAALLQNLRVDVIGTTNVLDIKYMDPDPATAARLANAFAAAYVDFRAQQAIRSLQSAARAVKVQIDEVKSLLADTADQLAKTRDPSLRGSLESQQTALIGRLGVLQDKYLSLQPNGAMEQSAGQIVQRAGVPTSPVSPDKGRNAALAILGGLVLGLGLGLARERLDDRVTTVAELESTLGAPVIGAVARVPEWRRADIAQLVMRTDPKSPSAEAYRALGTNIQYLATKRPMKILLITSSLAGDGKSATAANLALALAETGNRVILISADLRRPRVHRFFGMPNHAGLSDILTGKLSLGQVAQETDPPNLRVVPAGPVPLNPAELLGGTSMAGLIRMLSELCDYAILDAPPTLACADASILGPRVDATIWVVAAGQLQTSSLSRTRSQLQHAGATVVGAVYNNFDPGRSSLYPYHSYYGEYYYGEEGRPSGSQSTGRRRGKKRRGVSVVLEKASAIRRWESEVSMPKGNGSRNGGASTPSQQPAGSAAPSRGRRTI